MEGPSRLQGQAALLGAPLFAGQSTAQGSLEGRLWTGLWETHDHLSCHCGSGRQNDRLCLVCLGISSCHRAFAHTIPASPLPFTQHLLFVPRVQGHGPSPGQAALFSQLRLASQPPGSCHLPPYELCCHTGLWDYPFECPFPSLD